MDLRSSLKHDLPQRVIFFVDKHAGRCFADIMSPLVAAILPASHSLEKAIHDIVISIYLVSIGPVRKPSIRSVAPVLFQNAAMCREYAGMS